MRKKDIYEKENEEEVLRWPYNNNFKKFILSILAMYRKKIYKRLMLVIMIKMFKIF